MKFRLIIDKTKDEEVVATVHDRSALTDQLRSLSGSTAARTASRATPRTT